MAIASLWRVRARHAVPLLGLAGGARVAEEDYVGIEAAAEDGERFAVGGPGEAAAALVGGELGDVVAGTAVDGLDPDVVDAVFADSVGEGFAVGSEVDAAGDMRIGRKQLVRAFGSGIEADDRDFLVVRRSGGNHGLGGFGEDEGEPRAIGRNVGGESAVDGIGDAGAGNIFPGAAINRDAANAVGIVVDEIDPLAVGRAAGILIAVAGGELLEIRAVEIDAPDAAPGGILGMS